MTKKQKTETRIANIRHWQRRGPRRRKRQPTTNPSRFFARELPEHKPRERTIERIDGGFVLFGGWQVKYDPESTRARELYQALGRREAEMDARKQVARDREQLRRGASNG
jgi:type II secretory pathway component PulM